MRHSNVACFRLLILQQRSKCVRIKQRHHKRITTSIILLMMLVIVLELVFRSIVSGTLFVNAIF